MDGFAKRLSETLDEKDLSYSDLARMIGYHRWSVLKWCRGDNSPNAIALAEICVALDVSADWLLFGKQKRGE